MVLLVNQKQSRQPRKNAQYKKVKETVKKGRGRRAVSEDAHDPKSIDTRINHGSKRKASGTGQIHQVVTAIAFLDVRAKE